MVGRESTSANRTGQRWQLLRDFVLKQKHSTSAQQASVRRYSWFGLIESNVTSETTDYVHVEYQLESVRIRTRQRSEGSVRLQDLAQSSECSVDSTGIVCVWPAEEILSYYLCQQYGGGQLGGKRVLEVGAGMTGLAGLICAAACHPEQVCITDGYPQAVDMIQHNIELNSASLTQQQQPATQVTGCVLRWEERFQAEENPIHRGGYDLIVGADCLFFKDFHWGLIHVLSTLLRQQKQGQQQGQQQQQQEQEATAGGLVLMFAPRRGGTLELFMERASERFELTLRETYDDRVLAIHRQQVHDNRQYDADLHYPLLLEMRLK